MPGFEVVEQEVRPGAFVLALHGELDLATAYAFDRALLDVEARHPQRIVVDLRDLRMLDSAGLARLLAAHRRARRGGWKLVLIRGARIVQAVFAATALTEHLMLVRDVPAALER
jgi:anti-sigma B factor antagonist